MGFGRRDGAVWVRREGARGEVGQGRGAEVGVSGKLGREGKAARSSRKIAYGACGRENGSGSAAEDPLTSIFGIFWSSLHFLPFAPKFSRSSSYCQIPAQPAPEERPNYEQIYLIL